MDASLDACLLLNSEGNIVRMNPIAEQFFARTGNEVPSTHASSYLVLQPRRNTESENTKSDDIADDKVVIPLFWEDILEAMKSGSVPPQILDAMAIRKDGLSSFPVVVSLARLPLCTCNECKHRDNSIKGGQREDATALMPPSSSSYAFCAYIHEQISSDQHTKNQETEASWFRTKQPAIDLSSEPYFRVDGSGVIMSANRAAADLYDWTRDELFRETLSSLINVAHARRHDQYLRTFL
mmetsp:Transcript_48272/g.145918  ORF Transcript_48272/g.145918 Transcript_48272/m.145918 type:complete len:239 (-) Transcript_48272:4054-4770(-)